MKGGDSIDRSKEAAALFDQRAAYYQELYMDVSQYAESLNQFCDLVTTPNATVLELACGPGNATRYFLDRRPDLKFLGTDLSGNMVDLARINNPSAEFLVMDARKVLEMNQSYHAMVIAFLIPYLNRDETERLLIDSSERLLPNGYLYLSWIEDDYETSGPRTSSKGDVVHMYFYRFNDIATMCKLAGLELVHESYYQTVMANGQPVVDRVVIARKPIG